MFWCGVELQTIEVVVLEVTVFCTTWLDYFDGDPMLVVVVMTTLHLVNMVALGFTAIEHVFMNM